MPHPLHLFKFCPICGSADFVENNFKSKRCKACGFVYYFNPSSAVVALIFNSRKQLLVAVRANDPGKGTYDLPGGFVDMNETAEQAVCREVQEETNLSVVQTEYLFSEPNIYLYSGFEVQTLDMVFRCQVDDFSAMSAHDDVAGLHFVDIEKLDFKQFGLQSVKQIIKRIQKTMI